MIPQTTIESTNCYKRTWKSLHKDLNWNSPHTSYAYIYIYCRVTLILKTLMKKTKRKLRK